MEPRRDETVAIKGNQASEEPEKFWVGLVLWGGKNQAFLKR
jgi:hypothetical protein